MQVSNLMKILVSVILGVVVFSAILIPVTSDATSSTKTYTNVGTPYAAYDGEEHTIVVSYSDSAYVITVDDVVCETPDLSEYGAATIVYGEDGFIRLGSNGKIRGYSDGELTNCGDVSADVTSTITLSSSGASITYGTTTRTMTFSPLAYVAPEGDYVLTSNPCVDDDTVIIGGTTGTTTDTTAYVAYGSIDSLTTDTVYFYSTDNTLSVSSVAATVSTTGVDGDLVRIDSIVFTATLSNDSTVTGTYTYFLAPSEITYDNPIYAGSINSVLINIIPMLVLVGLVLGVVGAVIARRD